MTVRCAPRGIRAVETRTAVSTPAKAFEMAVVRVLDVLPYGSQRTFARGMEVSDQWVSRMRDPFDPIHFAASKVPRACQLVGSVEPVNEMFEDVRVNGMLWHMVPRPERVAPDDLRLDAIEGSEAFGKYLADLARALKDNVLEEDEIDRIEPQLVALHEQIGAQLAAVRAARGGRR